MALTELEVNTSSLANDRMAMEELLSRMQGVLDEIYTEEEELNAMWTGPSNQAFQDMFRQDQMRITEITKGMKEFLEKLEAVQHDYEECENAAADIVAAIRV